MRETMRDERGLGVRPEVAAKGAPAAERHERHVSEDCEGKLVLDDLDDSCSETSAGKGSPRCCSCGHDRQHFMVEQVPEYTTSGWLTVIFGISTIPKRIKYRCSYCKEVIEETTDPAVLRCNIS